MAKKKTKVESFTDDDDALLAELGVETEAKEDQTYTAKQERIIAGFETFSDTIVNTIVCPNMAKAATSLSGIRGSVGPNPC